MSEQVIEIPSKRIYENENNKIIKNKYANSSIDMLQSSMEMKYNYNVGGTEQSSETTNIQDISVQSVSGDTGSNRPIGWCDVESKHYAKFDRGAKRGDLAGVVAGISTKYHNVTFRINKRQNYNLDEVREIIDGVEISSITPEFGDNILTYTPRVDVQITNEITTTVIAATMYIKMKNIYGDIESVRVGNTYKGTPTTKTETENHYDIPFVETKTTVSGDSSKWVATRVKVEDKTACKSTDKGDYFDVSTTFQTYLKTMQLSGSYENIEYANKEFSVPLSGTLVERVPKKVILSAKGNVKRYETVEYVFEDGNQSNNSNTFSTDINELFQNNTKVGNTQIDKYMSDTVLGGWKNGKETAEIQCSVNDYKSIIPLSGNVGGDAISTINYTLPFMFRVGNVVCPMKATVSGDKPISTFDCNGGGSTAKFPKLFRVTGISPKYDGALWQTLTLQETYPQYNVTIDTTNAKGIAAGSLIHNVTSSRCTKGSFSSTKPHYGDTMYIEFSAGTGYTAEMNISGSVGTTYKSITKSTAPQNRYIAWVYGIADDFDVTITTEFAMTPPIFTSIYLNDDNTWAYRDIVNKNNYQVNCKVTVIVNGKVTARDEWRILANSYWDIGESQSPAAFGSVGTNGIATIKAEFSYTTTQNELITKTSTMQIGGKLAQPEIVYAEFYSNDGQSYVEVEAFNPCPVAVDMGVAVEDENSQVAYKQQRVEAYSNEVIQLDVTSSLDYMNSRVRARSSYFSGSTARKPFADSDTTYSQID